MKFLYNKRIRVVIGIILAALLLSWLILTVGSAVAQTVEDGPPPTYEDERVEEDTPLLVDESEETEPVPPEVEDEPEELEEPEEPAPDYSIDYLAVMEEAATRLDYEAGRTAEAIRNAKIDLLELGYVKISFDELLLLSKIMYAEAGSSWLSDEWKMCVGEVVLNRMASPEFPDTMAEVLAQPGQYYGRNSRYFNNLKPSLLCVQLAARLLNGERIMNDPSVVFQANFRQGSGTHTAFYDKHLGWTYFCYSSRPSLYQ